VEIGTFEQEVEAPVHWSDNAVAVVASKYFYGKVGSPTRERSVWDLIDRVVVFIADRAVQQRYMDRRSADALRDDLAWLILHQCGSFNSPVWFNCGIDRYGPGRAGGWRWDENKTHPVPCHDDRIFPQVSACFILGVEDNMDSIMQLASDEALLFKHGSGSGVNLSEIRGKAEGLSGGGNPSGPVSFMRIYDSVAGIVKSGGKTRRAAKMQILDCDHPDLVEFIDAKAKEEEKARDLVVAGWSGGMNGEAYESVAFQNANLSVRVTNQFMAEAESAESSAYDLVRRTDGKAIFGDCRSASELLDLIASRAHACGDPGLLFGDQMNQANPVPSVGPVRATNPCGEFQFLDNSACNLASLNLMAFVGNPKTDSFQRDEFRSAVRAFIIAQDILVDAASYPTAEVCTNSHLYRPLGLGYTNLAAVLMGRGIPYDSDEGRRFAEGVTQLLTDAAWETSLQLGRSVGPFPGYFRLDADGRQCLQEIIDQQRGIVTNNERSNLYRPRNAQVTLLAPTGTISFMMDCDSTGIEPLPVLRSIKSLVGGGHVEQCPVCVRDGLAEVYGCGDEDEELPSGWMRHPVFATAIGSNPVSIDGHLLMMAAVQPYLSGGISKTVNLPSDASVQDVRNVYVEAWKLGLKAVAVYRDTSKEDQPIREAEGVGVSSGGELAPEDEDEITDEEYETAVRTSHRDRLPVTRNSLTHKFDVAGHEGYLTVGLYEDGRPGELFVTMSKEGSTVAGLMDSFAIAVSLGLQYGVPLPTLCNKFRHQRFEPSGMVLYGDDEIKQASSLVDYVFTWLHRKFLLRTATGERMKELVVTDSGDRLEKNGLGVGADLAKAGADETVVTGPPCSICGAMTERTGSCYSCRACGGTSGCG
jgi:ribonucleoside-diphosphate reductase alpha chain